MFVIEEQKQMKTKWSNNPTQLKNVFLFSFSMCVWWKYSITWFVWFTNKIKQNENLMIKMLGECNNFSQFCWNSFIYFIIILHLKFHAKNHKLCHFKNTILIFHTLWQVLIFFGNSPNIIYVHHLLKTSLCQVSSFSNILKTHNNIFTSINITRTSIMKNLKIISPWGQQDPHVLNKLYKKTKATNINTTMVKKSTKAWRKTLAK